MVGSGVPNGTRLTNTTSVDSVTPDRAPGNNFDDAEVVVRAEADLRITKSHPAGPVLAGNDLTFTMTVENLGPSDAVADVEVTDTLPAGFSFVAATGPWDCAPGTVDPQIVSCTYLGGALIATTPADPLVMVVAISPDTPEGTYDNVARVASPTTDPVPGNNTATDPVDVVVVADVSIVKTHDPATVKVGPTTGVHAAPSATTDRPTRRTSSSPTRSRPASSSSPPPVWTPRRPGIALPPSRRW